MLVYLFFSPLPVLISLSFCTLPTVSLTLEKYALIDIASSRCVKTMLSCLCIACDRIIQHISWCMINTNKKVKNQKCFSFNRFITVIYCFKYL